LSQRPLSGGEEKAATSQFSSGAFMPSPAYLSKALGITVRTPCGLVSGGR
jgi:hypothetical protein